MYTCIYMYKHIYIYVCVCIYNIIKYIPPRPARTLARLCHVKFLMYTPFVSDIIIFGIYNF